MFHLRKKIDKDEEEEKELPVKKVRHRKKKKEEIKPWGKIERIIVLTILLLSPILSIFFLVKSKNPDNTKILGDTTTNVIKNTSVLKNSLEGELKNKTGTYGLWIQALDNSYSLGINENEKFDGDSLFKLPLMIAYYQGVDSGKINPQTPYTLKYSDQQTGAGVLATLPPGTVITYQDMVDYMGKDSDNSAFAIMESIVGIKAELDVMASLGMRDTDYSQGLTTPSDVGQLFLRLLNTDIISSSSKNKLLTSLKQTKFEDLIPAGIPDSIVVAHKYGAYNKELNDAGIIFTSKPYVLVILAKDVDESAQTEFPALSKIVYDWAN